IPIPSAQFLSAAMLLRFSFGLEKQPSPFEQAVRQPVEAGPRPGDIPFALDSVNPRQRADAILSRL
ncbi:MAG: isocitrate/isopropylmalate family dehydrogenase, partial [Puniceicoccaceae bacterium]